MITQGCLTRLMTLFILLILTSKFEMTEIDDSESIQCVNALCPPGYKSNDRCSSDAKEPNCSPCDNGTYSPSISRSTVCAPCTTCGENETQIFPCRKVGDTICHSGFLSEYMRSFLSYSTRRGDRRRELVRRILYKNGVFVNGLADDLFFDKPDSIDVPNSLNIDGQPCKYTRCSFGENCVRLRKARAEICICNKSCPTTNEPVCGSDGISYNNSCWLNMTMCELQKEITIAKGGKCEDSNLEEHVANHLSNEESDFDGSGYHTGEEVEDLEDYEDNKEVSLTLNTATTTKALRKTKGYEMNEDLNLDVLDSDPGRKFTSHNGEFIIISAGITILIILSVVIFCKLRKFDKKGIPYRREEHGNESNHPPDSSITELITANSDAENAHHTNGDLESQESAYEGSNESDIPETMDFCAPYNAMANITRTEFTESASFSQIAAQATNNEEEKNNLSPTPQSSTTHLISKQQLRDYEASFSKHQVNCTDANISLNSKNTSDACTPIDSHRNASEQTPDNHFDFKMVATVDSNAFTMSHHKTGVSLIFPEDAIEVGTNQRIEVQVSRKYAPFNLRFDDEDSDLPLTLVVNCLSPGLKRFSKPVIVKIPHRGILDRDSECKVLYSQSPVGSKMSWQCLEKPKEKEYNNIVTDCYFTVDETYFYIVTQHFTTYTCTCKATVPLNLQVIVYGRYELRAGDKQEVYFNLYFCDTIKDNQKAIEKYEGQNANHTQFYSLNSQSPKKSWVIGISQDEDWEWKVDKKYPDKQKIAMETVYRHCKDDSHTPPLVTFKVIPKRPQIIEYIEAFFNMVQMKKSSTEYEQTRMSIPFDFKLTPVNHTKLVGEAVDSIKPDLFNEDVFNDPNVVNERTLAQVARQLDRDWKSVIRSLLESNEGDQVINTVEDEQGQFYERKYHSLLEWKKRKGSDATYRVLREALTENGFKSIADTIPCKCETTV